MRAVLGLLFALIASPALAQDQDRFNLFCREFDREDRGRFSDVLQHEFSIDLEAMTVCRRNNTRCWDVVRQGRFLELSYPFSDGTHQYEMFRLYDPRTGWLTQVIRREGEAGRSYGEAVCEVRAFESVMD